MTDQDDSRCLKCGHFNQLHDGKCRVPNCTCGHSDHAARVRELEEAVRVLAKYAHAYAINQRVREMSAGSVSPETIEMSLTSGVRLMQATQAMRDNPIAADAVKEAGR